MPPPSAPVKSPGLPMPMSSVLKIRPVLSVCGVSTPDGVGDLVAHPVGQVAGDLDADPGEGDLGRPPRPPGVSSVRAR